MELTDKQAEFISMYGAMFGRPRDWSEKQVTAGTSSAIQYLRWVDRCSLELIQVILNKFAADPAFHGSFNRPTLGQLRNAYNIATNRQQQATGGSITQNKCEYCTDGVRLIAVLQQNGVNMPMPYPHPKAVNVLRMACTSCPCRCETGSKMNEKAYHLDGKKCAWLFKLSFGTWMEFYEYRDKCRDMPRGPMTEETETPHAVAPVAPPQRSPEIRTPARSNPETAAEWLKTAGVDVVEEEDY